MVFTHNFCLCFVSKRQEIKIMKNKNYCVTFNTKFLENV